uniref:5'-(N(7)-methylguanosine 5'-triphospho)-[mRNA] hydrolase n=1 Tax=Scleropages formosus TaxID=113540 RepID=A0A8C9SPS1_SCLFO
MTASTSGTGPALLAKGLDISLAALQRQDPYINNIVDVASQVALYTFSNKANEWEKTDVEGTLFVYTRLASPRHGFTIMNRLSMDNQTEPITKELDFQLQDPFLLYRNARLSIYGIWFYDKEDCQRIAELMKNLTRQEQHLAQQGGQTPPGAVPASDGKAVDILQMLTKARDEYDKAKPGSEPKEIASGSMIHDNPNLIKPIPVKPLERQAPVHQQPHQVLLDMKPKQLSLAALFGSQSGSDLLSSQTGLGVKGSGGRPSVARSLSYEESAQQGGMNPAPAALPEPCLAIQKLMVAPPGRVGGDLLQPVSESPENRLSENDGAPQAHQCHSRNPLQRLFPDSTTTCCSHPVTLPVPGPTPATSQPPPLLPSLRPAQPDLTQSDLAQPVFFSPGKPSQVSPQELLQRLQLVQQEQNLSTDPPRPALAPRFQELPTWPDKAPTSGLHRSNLLFQVISPQRIPATVAPSLLLSPMVFTQTKSTKGGPETCFPSASLLTPRVTEEQRVLTRSQLQATLLHLIQNDAAFLDTIYEAYVSSITKDSTAKNF